jgi:hypothetical protein
MTDEAKTKRPVPPQFMKKKKEVEEANTAQISESPISQSEEKFAEKKEIDMHGLVRDLMLNRFFLIMEKEARPLAEKMVSEGSHTLHDVKWFLSLFERMQLAKELKEKYKLS